MSNQGFGFGMGGADDDEGINLSLGLETTGGLDDFTPVPEGTHRFVIIEPPEVSMTQGGPGKYVEHMLTMKCKVDASNVTGATGMTHKERLVIPGPERQAAEPEKWKTMMKMLRNKLEAITGEPWRDDNLKLKPRSLSGKMFVATVKHEKGTYTKDGETKEATNANLSSWQPAGGSGQAQPAAVVSGADMAAQLAAQQAQAGQSPPAAPVHPAQPSASPETAVSSPSEPAPTAPVATPAPANTGFSL